jgi:hypothetical protein
VYDKINGDIMKCKICGLEDSRMYYIKTILSEGRGGHPLTLKKFGPLCHEHMRCIDQFEDDLNFNPKSGHIGVTVR